MQNEAVKATGTKKNRTLLVNKHQVKTFIPQQPPFVMVDGLMESDEKGSTTQLTVEPGNIFCKEGVFHEPGLIENMAQTAALAAGYKAKKNNDAVKTGYIGAVKHLQIFSLPKVGDTLTTHLTMLNEVMQANIIRGEIRVDGHLTATCEMTIFTAV